MADESPYLEFCNTLLTGIFVFRRLSWLPGTYTPQVIKSQSCFDIAPRSLRLCGDIDHGHGRRRFASAARQFRCAPEEAQFTPVAGERLAPRGVAGVADAELLARRAHDRRETRVVQVADVRQQVVLDLVIQPADVQIQQPVARREVHGRLDLVHGPLVVDVRRVAHRLRERGIAVDVRELEDHAQDQADRQHHDQEANQHLPPWEDQQRKREHDHEVEQLAGPERDLVRRAHLRVNVVGVGLADQHHHEVAHDEVEADHAVHHREVPGLDLEQRLPRRAGREAHQAERLDVVVEAGDVGVGVMPHVVLGAPAKPAHAQHLGAEADQLVDARIIGVAAVVGVVHDVEADRGDGHRPHHAQDDVDQRREMAEQQKQVRTQPPGQRDRRLEVHGRHVARGDVVVAQIGVDTLVERFSEIALLRELETSYGRFSNDIRRSRQFDSPPS